MHFIQTTKQQLQNEGSIHKGEHRQANIKKKRNGKKEYFGEEQELSSFLVCLTTKVRSLISLSVTCAPCFNSSIAEMNACK